MFYSEYARHCMKFYTRHPQPQFRNEVDRMNWRACESAVRKCTENERAILRSVYGRGDTIADNVYQTAKAFGVEQNLVWKLIKEVERRVAKRRMLI